VLTPKTSRLQIENFIQQLREQEKTCAPDSFFLSSNWLEPYLLAWEAEEFKEIFSIPADSGKHLIHAVLSQTVTKSKFGTSFVSTALNQACLPKLSDINIEQGGFVGASRVDIQQSLQALLNHLSVDNTWSELKLNAICSSQKNIILQLSEQFNLQAIQTYSSTSYWVKFDEIRNLYSGDFLRSRSPNTRQQIRRSMKILQTQYGDVSLHHPTSALEAKQWLDELIEMHRKRWNTETSSSGFMKSSFAKFHQDMVTKYFSNNIVEVIKVVAGKTPLGINVYYTFNNAAHFIFGGVNYDIDTKARPGIITHLLAVNDYLKRDYSKYDFLEGEHRYKQSLCTHTEVNHGWLLQRRRIDLIVENALRKIKRKIYPMTNHQRLP
jgi:hypothetical protein